MKAAALQCPKCGSDHVHGQGKRYALYPAGCTLILPLPVAWLHRCSTPYDFDCRSCGRRFSRRTGPAKIAFGALASVIVLLLVAIVWLFFLIA